MYECYLRYILIPFRINIVNILISYILKDNFSHKIWLKQEQLMLSLTVWRSSDKLFPDFFHVKVWKIFGQRQQLARVIFFQILFNKNIAVMYFCLKNLLKVEKKVWNALLSKLLHGWRSLLRLTGSGSDLWEKKSVSGSYPRKTCGISS